MEFVSSFFCSLGMALDMKLHFTSGYHPKGDGQTERMNQTLEQYLRVYCNYQQNNWSDLLPIAEFAYNIAPNAMTGITPFFANKGYIQTYLSILNETLPHIVLVSLLLTLMISTSISERPSLRLFWNLLKLLVFGMYTQSPKA